MRLNNLSRSLRRSMRREDPGAESLLVNGGAPAGDPPAGAPPAAGSLLDGVTPPAGTEGTPPASGDDWMPEKFRVMDAEGKVDEAASARKLADSYRALEAHKGPLSQAPAAATDYVLEAPKDAEGKPMEGFDAAAFMADPAFTRFAEGAHAVGMTQQQLQYAVERYLTVVPELLQANQGLELEEAKTALSAVWTDDATMQRNLAGVVKAIDGFGAEADDVPGSRATLLAKYGRDPDFIAFAARVASEMQEDKPIAGSGALGSVVDVDALMKSEAYWKPAHPDHARVKATVQAHFIGKHGTKGR